VLLMAGLLINNNWGWVVCNVWCGHY